MNAEALYLRVKREGQAMTLRLVQDPEQRERALLHVLGWGVSHVERVLAPALAEVLALSMRELSRLSGAPVPVWKIAEPVASAFVRAGATRGTLARVSVLRQTPARMAWPRWPSTLRSGRPAPGAVWPFDPELAGLRAGLRTVIKREALTPEHAEQDGRWLAAADLRVRTTRSGNGSPGADPPRIVTWAAGDDAVLDEAIADEHAIGGRGDAADSAVRRLGSRLGYPTCCIDRFVSLGARDDTTLASVLLPRLDGTAHDPLGTWLAGPLALVSHAPCSLDCAATRALAASLLAALDQDTPGFATAWRALATRMTAVDTSGRTWLLRTSPTEDRWRSTLDHAEELLADPIAPLRAHPDLQGRELRLTSGSLEHQDSAWRLPWASDHQPR